MRQQSFSYRSAKQKSIKSATRAILSRLVTKFHKCFGGISKQFLIPVKNFVRTKNVDVSSSAIKHM